MWQWRQRRPSRCVKIGPRDVAWAEMHRDWRGQVRYRSQVASLPEGVVRLSPLEPNVLQPSDLQARIRDLAGPVRPVTFAGRELMPAFPNAVTLILPDLAVRLAVLHLQNLPVRHEEREALIRWRLGQDQLFSLAGAKVSFQVLPASGRPNGTHHTILAVVAQETVLEQYEAACEAVGLLPQQVEVSSLTLFNLWVRASGGLNRLSADFLWVNVSDGGFTAFVFHKGHLVFLRTKLQGLGASHHDGVPEGGSSWADRIVEECTVSVYACQQRHPSVTVSHVVLVGDNAEHQELCEKLGRELGVSVKGLGWEDLRHTRGQLAGTPPLSALPAMAGLL